MFNSSYNSTMPNISEHSFTIGPIFYTDTDVEYHAWEDLQFDFERYRSITSSIYTFDWVFNSFILPELTVIGFIVNILLLTVTCRRSIKRYHYTFTYYKALAIVDIIFLMLVSYLLLFSSVKLGSGLGNFMCKLLNFIQHSAIQSYSYILAAIAFERCLVVALANRERFGKTPTSSRQAAKREMGSDWLSAIALRFSNQWATTLTTILIFVGICLNNLWVWWVYNSPVGIDHCFSSLHEGTVWQYAFRLMLWLLPMLFVTICNIILICLRIKRRSWYKEQLLSNESTAPKIEEIQSVSGGTAQNTAAAEFNARVQGSYDTEFSRSNLVESDELAPRSSTDASVDRNDHWISWDKLGEPRPNNNDLEPRATWSAERQTVEISSASSGLNDRSPSGRNPSCNFEISDLMDEIKQNALTLSLHSISILLLVFELPNIIAHNFYYDGGTSHISHILLVLFYIITKLTFTIFILTLPIVLFCLHRAVILREVRVMWGEIVDIFEKLKAYTRRPTLFDRGVQPGSKTPADRDDLVLDMETV